MKELWSLARDASVAVGAYVGMVRDRFWAELSNGDGFDERVARAKTRMEAAADALADKEAAEEVSDGWWLNNATECRCPSCTDVLQAEQESSSTGSPRKGAVEEPPEVEPTPPVKAPSGGISAALSGLRIPWGPFPEPEPLTEQDVRRIVREETAAIVDEGWSHGHRDWTIRQIFKQQ